PANAWRDRDRASDPLPAHRVLVVAVANPCRDFLGGLCGFILGCAVWPHTVASPKGSRSKAIQGKLRRETNLQRHLITGYGGTRAAEPPREPKKLRDGFLIHAPAEGVAFVAAFARTREPRPAFWRTRLQNRPDSPNGCVYEASPKGRRLPCSSLIPRRRVIARSGRMPSHESRSSPWGRTGLNDARFRFLCGERFRISPDFLMARILNEKVTVF